MKPAITLKELFKPPFYNDREGVIVEEDGCVVCTVQPRRSLDLIDFIVAALNEKWERDYGKPLRWIRKKEHGYCDVFICPYQKCGLHFSIHAEGEEEDLKHCPSCGRRLDPPEGN